MTDERQQRRLTTILAADVFGYSRLTAENEEDTLRTLKAHRAVINRLIERHDGRIFNTAGDSVLAEFGSAVEAVRCAITIQEELRVRNAQIAENRRMLFRIGVNVGDVLVDGDNLYGDGINVAAQLESIAEPGNICISGSVFALVKNKLSYGFEDIGPQTVKNIPDPVPAFRLIHGSGASQVPVAVRSSRRWALPVGSGRRGSRDRRCRRLLLDRAWRRTRRPPRRCAAGGRSGPAGYRRARAHAPLRWHDRAWHFDRQR